MLNVDNAPAAIQRLTKEIRVLVEKGNREIENIKAAGEKIKYSTKKAAQFYTAAGLHLKTLKDHSTSTAAWVKLAKEKCNLGRTRAFELLALAEGRTTVEQVRADTNKRKVKHRSRPFQPSGNGQSQGFVPDPSDITVPIRRLAQKLVQVDVELARELRRVLQQGGASPLVIMLDTEIEIFARELRRVLQGGAEPLVSVLNTEIKVAGADPGPFPDILRRGQIGGVNH
jgi:hypothetical protein